MPLPFLAGIAVGLLASGAIWLAYVLFRPPAPPISDEGHERFREMTASSFAPLKINPVAPMFVNARVVSEEGAALKVTEYELSPETKRALCIGRAKLPGATSRALAFAMTSRRDEFLELMRVTAPLESCALALPSDEPSLHDKLKEDLRYLATLPLVAPDHDAFARPSDVVLANARTAGESLIAAAAGRRLRMHLSAGYDGNALFSLDGPNGQDCDLWIDEGASEAIYVAGTALACAEHEGMLPFDRCGELLPWLFGEGPLPG